MELIFKKGRGWRAFAATAIGNRHATNDDSFIIGAKKSGVVAAVCDGVSEHFCALEASKAAARYLERKKRRILNETKKHGWKAGKVILEEAQRKVKRGETTATIAVIDLENMQLHTWNVGDSYGYLIREGSERMLIEEHTGRLFDFTTFMRKDIDINLWHVRDALEKMRQNPSQSSHIICSSLRPVAKENVGLEIISYNGKTILPENESMLQPITLEKNDVVLLTSDGLSDYLEEIIVNYNIDILREIRRELIIEKNPDYIIDLMEVANEFKGDDVTFIAIIIDHL
ncbi:MAG: protein phosphatase 2C domain-containing protein [Candidatus Bilamarchaeaceae archaeon]